MMNNFFFLEYNSLLVFLICSLIISIVLVLVSYLSSTYSNASSVEKLSAYECGFEPFEDARNSFDVRFYLIAILFLIFDIEIVFLFPWSVTFFYTSSFGFWVVIDFFIELVVGYIYIWKKGALD